MSLRGRYRALLVTAASCGAASLAAQNPAEPREVFAGSEIRSLSFERLPSLKRLRQVGFPLGVIVPLGRFRVDLGSAFVSTELRRVDGTAHRVDHLTDTQLRGAYVFGRDAIVATFALNLPTGPRNASTKDYAVLGAVSPSLLGFPVAAYANGFSATAGVAAAVPAGNWSVGFAGSLRVSSRFTPYRDSSGPIVYKPGVEGRVRGGLDGLIGASKLSVGFTYSTFGDDQFGSVTTTRGQYRPGPRWLAEAAFVAPVGSSLVSLSLWNFHRTAGDTTGTSTRNRENLAALELSLSMPLAAAVVFEPGFSGRLSRPESGRGQLVGTGVGFRFLLRDGLTVTTTGRYDWGWIKDDQGLRSGLRGWYGAVLLRVSP